MGATCPFCGSRERYNPHFRVEGNQLIMGNRPAHISPAVAKLLRMLIENDQPLSRHEIAVRIYGCADGAAVHAVSNLIWRLKEHLWPHGWTVAHISVDPRLARKYMLAEWSGAGEPTGRGMVAATPRAAG